jgi:hypothetical protein
MQYHSLSKIGTGYPRPLFYNQTTKRFIKVRYAQKTSDWSDIEKPDQIFTYDYFKAA